MAAEAGLLKDFGIALGAALVGGLAARALRLPVVAGYLAAGVAVGPRTPGFIADETAVRAVAEIGVALLMFAVGVQFSLKELVSMKRIALQGGGAQITATVLLGMLVGLLIGWDPFEGLFLGCCLSLSSTAVIMRTLEERGEIGSGHGLTMMSVNIAQDLSLVIMIALLPALKTVSMEGPKAFAEVGLSLFTAGLFVAATLLLSLRVVPRLLHRVATINSRELFLMSVIAICFAAAGAARFAGLSLEMGAFLAGLVVSESDYAHDIFSQVRPLRDVFASIFFVSVGMLLEPQLVASYWPAILAVIFAILVGKAVITSAALYSAGLFGRTNIISSFGLANIGEFSFVLAATGTTLGLVDGHVPGVILAAALVTLLFAPGMFKVADFVYGHINASPRLAGFMNRISQDEQDWLVGQACPDARVVIVGYGRVGRYVSDALRAKRVQHVVIDYDTRSIERGKSYDVSVIYGDATSDVVLKQVRPDCVELVIVALPDANVTEMVVRAVKRLAPSVSVVARVHRGWDIPRMRSAGAAAVIHAEFEAGTEMIRQVLDRLGYPDPDVDAYIESVRQHRYRREDH